MGHPTWRSAWTKLGHVPATFNVLEDVLDERTVGGSTGVRMERMSAGILATYVVMLAFVWSTGMDAGVVFCRREDFEALGRLS